MKFRSLILISLFLHNSVSFAESISPKTLKEAETFTPLQLQSYRQTEYKLDDPAGDYALLKRSQLVPKRIFRNLLGLKGDPNDSGPDHNEDYMEESGPVVGPVVKKSPSEQFQEFCVKNPDLAPIFSDLYASLGQDGPDSLEKYIIGLQNVESPIQGRDNPIIREGFSKMFAQVITEEKANGIEPSYGVPHQWSQEFLDKHGKSSTMLASSKLLMALAVGETNRYMKTDKEADFHKWMLTQKDDSLEFSDVFRESYRLNNGDIYKTLLTIENVMAHQWHNGKREKLPFVKKLKPITSGFAYDKDKFGTWYHLFGIMLYGYVEGGLKANLIGRVEALGSVMLSPGVNKTQKQWMNKQGGLVGNDLAKLVKEKTYANHVSDKAHLKESNYLNKTEDFRDRIAVPVDKNIVTTISRSEDLTFIDIKDSKNRDLKNCKVEMIADTGTGLDSRKTDVAQNVTISGSSTRLQFYGTSVQKIRGFINCGSDKETLVFETK